VAGPILSRTCVCERERTRLRERDRERERGRERKGENRPRNWRFACVLLSFDSMCCFVWNWRVLLSVDSIELACRKCVACLLILYVCCFLRVLLFLDSMCVAFTCVAFYVCCFLLILWN